VLNDGLNQLAKRVEEEEEEEEEEK